MSQPKNQEGAGTQSHSITAVVSDVNSQNSQTPPFHVGQFVWIKMKGYPVWPGQVLELPDVGSSRQRYTCSFFNHQKFAHIPQKDLFDFVGCYRKFVTKALGKGTRDLGIISALEKTATGVLEDEKRAAGVHPQRQISPQCNEIRDENSEDLGRQMSGESQQIQSKADSQICSAAADGQSDQSKCKDKPLSQKDRQPKAESESSRATKTERKAKPVLRKREARKLPVRSTTNMLPPDGKEADASDSEGWTEKVDEERSQKQAKSPVPAQNESSAMSGLSKLSRPNRRKADLPLNGSVNDSEPVKKRVAKNQQKAGSAAQAMDWLNKYPNAQVELDLQDLQLLLTLLVRAHQLTVASLAGTPSKSNPAASFCKYENTLRLLKLVSLLIWQNPDAYPPNVTAPLLEPIRHFVSYAECYLEDSDLVKRCHMNLGLLQHLLENNITNQLECEQERREFLQQRLSMLPPQISARQSLSGEPGPSRSLSSNSVMPCAAAEDVQDKDRTHLQLEEVFCRMAASVQSALAARSNDSSNAQRQLRVGEVANRPEKSN